MKWKNSEDMINREGDAPKEDYFDEEQFSPWSDTKKQKKAVRFGKLPLLVLLLIVCIVASVAALLMLLIGGNGDGAAQQQLARMDERIQRLERRLDKYEAIDEKVTRIWEQAKSFEKFQDRFDRSEASTSLRMDHLTMSLEAVQTQLKEMLEKPAEPVAAAKSDGEAVQAKETTEIQYHQVVSGDTLYSISRRYNLSVTELLAINRMDKNNVIVPGQKLVVSKGPRN